MPQPPHTLNATDPYSDTISLINDNTLKTVQDIGDLGAKFSSGIGSYSFTLAAGRSVTQLVSVTDTRPQYQSGIQIVPRVETWVDTNGDDNYLLGFGGSLSTGQSNCLVSVFNARRKQASDAADFIVQHHNFDTASHTYYVNVDESYQNSPPQGIFR